MIEIEKKFLLTQVQEKALKKGAKFLGEKVFTDTYFDNSDYELTKNDIWLRMRDKNAELKMPIEHDAKEQKVNFNRYEEFESDDEIRNILNIKKGTDIIHDFHAAGYRPVIVITTRRERYLKEGFQIDIDACDFGYTIAEIELKVEGEEKMVEAEKKIIQFAKNHKLSLDSVKGKVPEYLYRKSRAHYDLLMQEGILVA